MMTKEPIIGMGMRSQQPQFVVGEAGPERLDVTPMPGANAGGMGNMRANLGGYMEAGSAALPPPSMNPALLRILAANINKVKFRPSYSTAGA